MEVAVSIQHSIIQLEQSLNQEWGFTPLKELQQLLSMLEEVLDHEIRLVHFRAQSYGWKIPQTPDIHVHSSQTSHQVYL